MHHLYIMTPRRRLTSAVLPLLRLRRRPPASEGRQRARGTIVGLLLLWTVLSLPALVFAQAPAVTATCTPSVTYTPSVALAWTAPGPQPAGVTVSNYVLERQTDTGTFTVLPQPPLTATTQSDAPLETGHTYTYRLAVQGKLADGTASQSAYATAGTPPPCVTVLAPPTVTLVLTGNAAQPPYGIEAQLSTSTGLVVQFLVDGLVKATESAAPFCLFGDQGRVPCTLGSLGAGAHTIVAVVMTKVGAPVLASAQMTLTEGTPPPVPLVPPSNLTATPQ